MIRYISKKHYQDCCCFIYPSLAFCTKNSWSPSNSVWAATWIRPMALSHNPKSKIKIGVKYKTYIIIKLEFFNEMKKRLYVTKSSCRSSFYDSLRTALWPKFGLQHIGWEMLPYKILSLSVLMIDSSVFYIQHKYFLMKKIMEAITIENSNSEFETWL